MKFKNIMQKIKYLWTNSKTKGKNNIPHNQKYQENK